MNKLLNDFRQQSIWYRIITIAAFVFAFFFLYRCCNNKFDTLNAINEYREAADVQLTQAFLMGENPYRLDSLLEYDGESMPPVVYQYSFFNSAVCSLVALILGKNVVLAHYIVALLSMIGSAVIIFLFIKRKVNNYACPMVGAALTLFCHWRAGYLSTTPNSLGIFLMLLTAYCASSGRLKERSRLIVTAVLSVLLFYTKLYFVTVALGIFVFYFMYRKKEAWKYFGLCILTGALSIGLMMLIWPLYFTYNLYFVNGMGLWYIPGALRFSSSITDIAAGTFAMVVNLNLDALNHLFDQFRYMFITFAGLFAVLLYSAITGAIKKKKINVTPEDTLSLCTILSITQGLCMLVLGKADGMYLTYFLQLWIPFVIAAAMICADKYVIADIDGIFKDNRLPGIAFLIILSLVSVYLGYKKLPLHVMTDEEKYNWQAASDYIEKYEQSDYKESAYQLNESKNVYYAPELAYIAINHNIRGYDNGHVEAAEPVGYGIWKTEKLSQVIFPYAGKIAEINIDYQNKVTDRIRNREYSLVTIDDVDCLGHKELPGILEESGYKRIDTLPLSVGNATYDVEFWVAE